jgi:hypothetical protein
MHVFDIDDHILLMLITRKKSVLSYSWVGRARVNWDLPAHHPLNAPSVVDEPQLSQYVVSPW